MAREEEEDGGSSVVLALSVEGGVKSSTQKVKAGSSPDDLIIEFKKVFAAVSLMTSLGTGETAGKRGFWSLSLDDSVGAIKKKKKEEEC
jgi:hypothetical protein